MALDRDRDPAPSRPWVTVGLMALSVAVYLGELTIGPALPGFLQIHGLVPARILDADSWALHGGLDALEPVASHLFLHGSWPHLLGNLAALALFGRRVEGRLGPRGFLGLFVVAGVLAAAGHVSSDPGSFQPLIGASGAVAGVMGAAVVILTRHKGARVLPTVTLLGLWWVLQVVLGTVELVDQTGGERGTLKVAFWAHVVGFVVGVLWARSTIGRSGRPTP